MKIGATELNSGGRASGKTSGAPDRPAGFPTAAMIGDRGELAVRQRGKFRGASHTRANFN